jgi:hypothetical protein
VAARPWGKHPIAPARLLAYSQETKTNHKKTALTFGHLIASVYDACGNRRAGGMIRLAVDAHVVVFRGQLRRVISEGAWGREQGVTAMRHTKGSRTEHNAPLLWATDEVIKNAGR